MRCDAVNSGTRCFWARHCDDGDAPMACHGLPACFQTSPRFGLCPGLRKGFALGGGPNWKLIGRRYLKQFWILTVFGTPARPVRGQPRCHHPIARPAGRPPLLVSQLSPSPTSDDGRGATREDAPHLDRASRRSELFGNHGRGPRDHRKRGAPTGRNRHLRVLSRSSLPVLSGCPHRRGGAWSYTCVSSPCVVES